MAQLRRLARNFLWAETYGTRDSRARVAWYTIIQSQAVGGLGIIDPIDFLTDPGAASDLGISLGFRWIPRVQTVWYLGF